MARNEWINGYLRAILHSGVAVISGDDHHQQRSVEPLAELKDSGGSGGVGHFNPTRYSIEEVVMDVDETDLHRMWIKVVATRNTHERSSCLENMCWSIWKLTHQGNNISGKLSKQLERRPLQTIDDSSMSKVMYMYEPYLWENEKKSYKQYLVLFGFLVQLNRLYTDVVQKLPTKSNILRCFSVP